jgi:hypothetical protein
MAKNVEKWGHIFSQTIRTKLKDQLIEEIHQVLEEAKTEMASDINDAIFELRRLPITEENKDAPRLINGNEWFHYARGVADTIMWLLHSKPIPKPNDGGYDVEGLIVRNAINHFDELVADQRFELNEIMTWSEDVYVAIGKEHRLFDNEVKEVMNVAFSERKELVPMLKAKAKKLGRTELFDSKPPRV